MALLFNFIEIACICCKIRIQIMGKYLNYRPLHNRTREYKLNTCLLRFTTIRNTQHSFPLMPEILTVEKCKLGAKP